MSKFKSFVILHIILALFSVSAVFSKLAAMEESLSFKWIIYYGAVLFIMFIYAIAWQQIIKQMPIVTAYANKAVTVIWGIIYGLIIFKEEITVPKIIGAVIIIAGVYLVVTGDEYDEPDKIRDVMNSEAANKEDDCR
ncbi:MAG: EamA family transporter [Lachnospiraceae bacterium]|nr:EamA family transporter [Lachnospiraceae bacterium]